MRARKPLGPFERGIHAGDDAAEGKHGLPDCCGVGGAARRVPEALRTHRVRMACEPRLGSAGGISAKNGR